MTREQEAQQAQTIAEILDHIANFDRASAPDWTDAYYDRQKLLEIVDSQAQKIAEQAKEIERLKDLVRKISGAEPDPFNIVAGVRRSHNKQQTAKR